MIENNKQTLHPASSTLSGNQIIQRSPEWLRVAIIWLERELELAREEIYVELSRQVTIATEKLSMFQRKY